MKILKSTIAASLAIAAIVFLVAVLTAGNTETVAATYWTTVYSDSEWEPDWDSIGCSTTTTMSFGSSPVWFAEDGWAHPTFSDYIRDAPNELCGALTEITTEDADNSKSSTTHYIGSGDRVDCTNQMYATLTYDNTGSESAHFEIKALFEDEDSPPGTWWKTCSIVADDDDCNVSAPSGVGKETIKRLKLRTNPNDATPDADKTVDIDALEITCSNTGSP
jgi:hypothetical protein